jgi:hypothetical protein
VSEPGSAWPPFDALSLAQGRLPVRYGERRTIGLTLASLSLAMFGDKTFSSSFSIDLGGFHLGCSFPSQGDVCHPVRTEPRPTVAGGRLLGPVRWEVTQNARTKRMGA